jgi:hypothetical protein
MDPRLKETAAAVEAAVEDLRRIAQRLMGLSDEGVQRAMAHTEGVDCLIGFVDQLDYADLLREETGSPRSPEPNLAASEPGSQETDPPPECNVEGLCRDIRCKAATLDRLNREGVGSASEVGELAAELMRIEGELRMWSATVSREGEPTA